MVLEWATEAGLRAASSILASGKRSIPHLDETGPEPIVAIDVVDVQNVNLIPLIVTFASVNQHRAVFPGSVLRFPSTRRGGLIFPRFGPSSADQQPSTPPPPPQKQAPSSTCSNGGASEERRFSPGQRAADAVGPSKDSAGVSLRLQMSRDPESITPIALNDGGEKLCFPLMKPENS